ncbi:MAG: hypothetical protein Q9218_007516 [Villophora microphyllina]
MVCSATAFVAVYNQIQEWSERLKALAEDEKKNMKELTRQKEAIALAERVRQEDREQAQCRERLRHTSPGAGEEIHVRGNHSMDVDREGRMMIMLIWSNLRDRTVKTTTNLHLSTCPTSIFSHLSSSQNPRDSTADLHLPPGPSEETLQLDDEPSSDTDDEMAVEQSTQLADAWAKEHKIKLRKGRKYKKHVLNRDAWLKGKKDSKLIQLRAARIEPATNAGGEEMDLGN